ncbi:MAG: hypothetical protein Ta2A_18920 [Treponemataceae bacterium]|nr:MAG: hypothetical protein Ta2A_18920 [Treponemataceae bacterium]
MKRVFSVVMFVGLTSSLFAAGLPKIHDAIEKDNLALVQQLVEKGADVNVRPTGRYGPIGAYPLESALSQKKYEIALYLLENGAEVTKETILTANRNKRYDIAKILVEKGGIDVNQDVFIFSPVFQDEDNTLEQKITIATDIAGRKITNPSILLLVGAADYKSVVDMLKLDLSNTVDALGSSILHVAAQRNMYDLVRYLLDNKFNVNTLDNNNQTALFYAITVFGPRIDWENPVIETAKSAKINFVSDMPYYGNARAVQITQVRIATALLDGGINVNQQNKAGWTVLHIASSFYPEGLQEFLVEKGARADLKTNFGRTAADVRAQRR